MKDVKYRQTFEVLRSEILLGKFDGRERFPSEGQLMRRFGVSRTTIRLALSELKQAGILESRAGSGTYLGPAALNATGYIGLIVPGYGCGEIFTPICAEIASAAAGEGYSLLFGSTGFKDPDVGASQALRLARDYAERHVAGVVIEPVDLAQYSDQITRQILAFFTEKSIPFILIDRDHVPPPDRSGHDLVGIDNVQAAYRLASYLISRGAREIRFFVRPESAYTTRLRAQGVAIAAIESGLAWRPSNVITAEPDDPETIAALVSGRRRADAVVCANDATAADLLSALAKAGVKVPKDVMVAGFDDVRIATQTEPRLTTMRQPCEQLARTAVQTLLQRIRNPSLLARKIELPAELVVRGSTR